MDSIRSLVQILESESGLIFPPFSLFFQSSNDKIRTNKIIYTYILNYKKREINLKYIIVDGSFLKQTKSYRYSGSLVNCNVIEEEIKEGLTLGMRFILTTTVIIKLQYKKIIMMMIMMMTIQPSYQSEFVQSKKHYLLH